MLWEWKKEKKVYKLRKILRFLDVSVLFFLNPRKDSKDEFIKEKHLKSQQNIFPVALMAFQGNLV